MQPAPMMWKYWDAREDFTGPRSYLLEREGAIVAHAGLWPLTFGAGESAVRGIHMIDWASAKEAPGAGLALVQKLAGLFDFVIAIGGSDMTRKALPAFGFVKHARQWKASLPLRPLQQMMTHQTRNWKLLPRLARNTHLAARAAKVPAGWHSTPIAPEAILPELCAPPALEARFSPRPAGFFAFLLRCPSASVSLHAIANGQGLQGHFALSTVRGQARVAGVWLREPRVEAWRAAYGLAQQCAKRLPGAYELVATGTEGSSGEGAAQAGFGVSQGAPVYLLNRKHKLSLPTDFQFQLSDDDEAVLDTGAANYWT